MKNTGIVQRRIPASSVSDSTPPPPRTNVLALAVFFAPGAQPAQAQTNTVWSATLTVLAADAQGISVGCSNVVGGDMACSSTTSAHGRRLLDVQR